MKSYRKLTIATLIIVLAFVVAFQFRPAPGSALPADPANIMRGAVIEGDTGYVITNHGNIYIFDVSNPLSPQTLPILSTPYDDVWQYLDAAGDRLYVFSLLGYVNAQAQNAVHVYDMSDPQSPNYLAQISVGGTRPPKGIRVSDDNQYLHLWYYELNGVALYDIHDLVNTQYVASYLNDCIPKHLRFSSQWAIVQSERCGETENSSVAIYDLSEPTSPVKLSGQALETLTQKTSFYDINGTTLYLLTDGKSSSYDDLKIIDVTNPANPVLLHHLELDADNSSYFPTGIEEEQGLLYISGWNWGELDWHWSDLQVYDVQTVGELPLIKHLFTRHVDSPAYFLDAKGKCSYRVLNGPIAMQSTCIVEYQGSMPR